MAQESNIKRLGRKGLKDFFTNGKIPAENHYATLIESMINQQDDGFFKDEIDGFVIAASGESTKLVSFYKNLDSKTPFFSIRKEEDVRSALCFQPMSENTENETDKNSFFFHEFGSLGIGKKSDPAFKLDVNGFMAMQGRTGTYVNDKQPANGKWHTITDDLDNCQAFEVVARTGLKGTGKFSIIHAIAVKAFQGSRGSVRRTASHYGFLWNRIRLRWAKSATTPGKYVLQIKTGRNYGNNVQIYYHITKLWDDSLFLPNNYYH